MQLSAKTDVVQKLEAQLSQSRKHFSGSCVDVSKLQQQLRDMSLKLSTQRAHNNTLQHDVSTTTTTAIPYEYCY